TILFRSLILIALTLLMNTVAHSQTPAPAAPVPTPFATDPCGQSGFENWLKCQKKRYDRITNKDGFHLVIGSVAPGGGLAGGVGYGHRSNDPNWRTDFVSSARISVKKYWELDANLRLTKTSSSTTASPDLGNLKINVYGLVKDMQRLDYFGLGPESREQDRA